MRVTNNQQIKDLFKDSKVSLPIEKLDRIDKLDKIIDLLKGIYDLQVKKPVPAATGSYYSRKH